MCIRDRCDTALIVARYRIGSDSAGAIGIIGPVRLPYPRLIPHLEYFANTLGKLLSDTYRSEASSPQQ